jgi:hypothetical protein
MLNIILEYEVADLAGNKEWKMVWSKSKEELDLFVKWVMVDDQRPPKFYEKLPPPTKLELGSRIMIAKQLKGMSYEWRLLEKGE